MPGFLFTDKKYFRIATESNYFCRTDYFYYDNHSRFHCFMQIRDGKDKNQFIKPTEYNRLTHPEFGINEMKSETFKINIMADDKGNRAVKGREVIDDYFRTLPKPIEPKESSLSWNQIKQKVSSWFSGWFE